MALFERAIQANVMSIRLLIRANVSKAVLREAYAIAREFEERYSAYKKDSFLNKINSIAGKQRVECTQEDIELFSKCIDMSKQSSGEFDITMGALSHGAYHFGFSNQSVADEKQIQKQKELVDFNLIDLGDNSIYLKKEGMRLDIGGIGKGYVAKKIALFLKENGATKALVDAGGEIVCFGKKYTIAIKDPFSKDNLAYIRTSKEPISISTSGDYERFVDSRDNNHILNKDSGRSSNLYSSMTLIQNGFNIDELDAYATAMFNKDEGFIKEFSKKMSLSTISVDKESSVVINNIRELKLDSLKFLY